MNSLLFTDPHFTDNEMDEYRWEVFRHLREVALSYEVGKIYCLGDLTDRKDRHSARLLNRLIEELSTLYIDTGAEIEIIAGNHDAPIDASSQFYWECLNNLENIKYHTQPTMDQMGVFLLPFAKNPVNEWKDITFTNAKAILIHQTVTGALIEGDRKIDNGTTLPTLPASVPIFSGDVHRPQQCGQICYVGTPHPIRYSEVWPNRVVFIKDSDWSKPLDVWLTTTKRAIIEISDTKELASLTYGAGDQLRIRYNLTGSTLTNWPIDEQIIRQWAKDKDIFLASVEAAISGEGLKVQTNTQAAAVELMAPKQVIEMFGKEEKLSQDIIDMGLTLLSETE